MSILIKGMEMPPRCGRCDMRIPVYDDGIFDHYECCVTAAIIDNLGEKMEDCPLVPVPPHGRLIEAEAAKEFIKPVDSIRNYEPEWTWGELYESNCNAIDKLPTIIPAEADEERREYEAQVEAAQYCEMYESTYDSETGAM